MIQVRLVDDCFYLIGVDENDLIDGNTLSFNRDTYFDFYTNDNSDPDYYNINLPELCEYYSPASSAQNFCFYFEDEDGYHESDKICKYPILGREYVEYGLSCLQIDLQEYNIVICCDGKVWVDTGKINCPIVDVQLQANSVTIEANKDYETGMGLSQGLENFRVYANEVTIQEGSFYNITNPLTISFDSCHYITFERRACFRCEDIYFSAYRPSYEDQGYTTFTFDSNAFVQCKNVKTRLSIGALRDWAVGEFGNSHSTPFNYGGDIYIEYDSSNLVHVLDRLVLNPDIYQGIGYEISPYAFAGCSSLIEVDISSGLETVLIGRNAFTGCVRLVSLREGSRRFYPYNSTASFNGEHSFNEQVAQNYLGIVTENLIVDGVVEYGTEYCVLHNGTTGPYLILPPLTFTTNPNLYDMPYAVRWDEITNVNINMTDGQVIPHAFSGFSSLQSTTVTAKSVGYLAFEKCPNLTNISIIATFYVTDKSDNLVGIIPDTTDVLQSLECGLTGGILAYLWGQEDNSWVGENVNSFRLILHMGEDLDKHIQQASNINELYLYGKGMTFDCLEGCDSLSGVFLSTDSTFTTLTTIFPSNLHNITFPSYIKKLGDCVFMGTSLYSVDLKNVEEIGEKTFYNCASLTKIVAHKPLTIGPMAFWGCSALETCLIEEIADIYEEAFNGCSALPLSEDGLQWISNWIVGPSDYSNHSLYINENCKGITPELFLDAPITKLDIKSKDIKNFDGTAFAYDNIKEVAVYDNFLTLFYANALEKLTLYNFSKSHNFKPYTNLKYLEICFPNTGNQFNPDGGLANPNLEHLVLNGRAFGNGTLKICNLFPFSVNNNDSNKYNKGDNVYVPKTLKKLTLKNCSVAIGGIGDQIESIEIIELSQCGAFAERTFNYFPSIGQFIVINNLSDIVYETENSTGQGRYLTRTVQNANKTLLAYAAGGLEGKEIELVPPSVSIIGAKAFANLPANTADFSISGIRIPSSVTKINTDAFLNNCYYEGKVKVTTLEDWLKIEMAGSASNPLRCFKNLYIGGEKATAITIPKIQTKIGQYAFYNCQSLQQIEFKHNIDVEYGAFLQAHQLNRVDVYGHLNAKGYAFAKNAEASAYSVEELALLADVEPEVLSIYLYGDATYEKLSTTFNNRPYKFYRKGPGSLLVTGNISNIQIKNIETGEIRNTGITIYDLNNEEVLWDTKTGLVKARPAGTDKWTRAVRTMGQTKLDLEPYEELLIEGTVYRPYYYK